jgi:hypothetical protein
MCGFQQAVRRTDRLLMILDSKKLQASARRAAMKSRTHLERSRKQVAKPHDRLNHQRRKA